MRIGLEGSSVNRNYRWQFVGRTQCIPYLGWDKTKKKKQGQKMCPIPFISSCSPSACSVLIPIKIRAFWMYWNIRAVAIIIFFGGKWVQLGEAGTRTNRCLRMEVASGGTRHRAWAWVFSRMAVCHVQASWGHTEGQRWQPGCLGPHLWIDRRREHAAQVHFAICHNFAIWFRRSRNMSVQVVCRQMWQWGLKLPLMGQLASQWQPRTKEAVVVSCVHSIFSCTTD